LRAEPPPLARVDTIDSKPLAGMAPDGDFQIIASHGGRVRTGVVADAATCPACLAEVRDPSDRRYRYPFTNCTHCGPRLTIIDSIPYDRAHTSMAPFVMCPECRAEYDDPADRRFHAQPNCCPACGPRVAPERLDSASADCGSGFSRDSFDRRGIAADWIDRRIGSGAPTVEAIHAAARLLLAGAIVAIKGLGGFHLACDACNGNAVACLRARKRRYDKPFALMARDLDVIRRYCRVATAEAALLESSRAPIVILAADGPEQVAEAVAPNQRTLGFMLPYTPCTTCF
jgi:hydrogenase maturation protein HypF